jgi:hypothetical protein
MLPKLLVILGCVAFPWTSLAHAETGPHSAEKGFATDTHGHRFRTEFPISQRWFAGFLADQNGDFSGTFGVQTRSSLDFPQEEVWWQLRHTWLNSRWDGDLLELTTVEGHYLRHDTSSLILVPGEVDIRLPAPFDIALDWRLGHVEDVSHDLQVEEVEVARIHLGADLVRDPEFRHRLVLAVVPYFVANLDDQGHRMSPFSQLSMRWGYHSPNGRWLVEAHTSGGYEANFARSEVSWDLVWQAQGRAEWIWMAVNDQPISLYVQGDADLNNGWTAAAGLRLSLLGF